jgi:hypothetical protein
MNPSPEFLRAVQERICKDAAILEDPSQEPKESAPAESHYALVQRLLDERKRAEEISATERLKWQGRIG